MDGATPPSESNRRGLCRRSLLRTAAAGAFVTVAGAQSGTATAEEVTYGESVTLGDGEVTPFTTASGGTVACHGVEFDRPAVTGSLPTAEELAADRTSESPTHGDTYSSDGKSLVVHRRESLQFFVPFPDAEDSPVTFLGLNWNPEGHPGGGGAWSRPHFDVHFHMQCPERVDAIEGPSSPPYDDIPAEKIPAGYARSPPETADERYITDMGEHLAPGDAPELPGRPEAFTNTLIQGFAGVDGEPRLSFVEPMLTREFLRGVEETNRYAIPQPDVYPHDDHHPTVYSVRTDDAAGTVTVAIRSFEPV